MRYFAQNVRNTPARHALFAIRACGVEEAAVRGRVTMEGHSGIQFGRYRLEKLIARGGMGEIYLARLVGVAGFEKKCVIKKIRSELASDSAFVERFLNEGRTLVAMAHSNIVQIFDMGVVGAEYYLAMEYVDGADLRVLMRKLMPGHVALDVALFVALEVTRGLSYAHRAKDVDGRALNVVHGDISPSNVLISREGEVKIIDFGIARSIWKNYSGAMEGKFAYMSPEQARGLELDRRTDIFSAAAVLYEMLSGRRPFECNAGIVSAEYANFSEYEKLSILNTACDFELDDILARALAVSREERMSSADEFSDAILAYAQARGMILSQRDIASYFGSYFDEALPVVGSANDIMSLALDRMLGVQSVGVVRTRTILPQAAEMPALEKVEKAFQDVRDERVKEDLLSSDGGREAGDGWGDGAENSGRTLPNPPSYETVDLWGRPDRRRTRLARIFVRLRYVIIGILLAVAGSFLFFWWIWHIDSPEKAAKVRDSILQARLQGMQDGVGGSVGEAAQDGKVLDDAWVSAYQNSYRRGNVPDLIGHFIRGVPFVLHMEPETATIYIVEGEYRALDERRFVLVSGHSAEIAVQAPGYETCMFRVIFNEGTQAYEHMQGEACAGIAYDFSLQRGVVDVSIKLFPIRAVHRESIDRAEALENSEKKSEIETLPEIREENGAIRPDNVEKPVKKEKKGRGADSVRRDITKAVVKLSSRSNVPARLKFGEMSCELPCELEGASRMRYAVEPIVNPKETGVAYYGVASSSGIVQISFCEVGIQVLESYISQDPAPYQVADIYLDGVRIVSQVDFARLVIPCGAHKIEARTEASVGGLRAVREIRTEPGKSTVVSLTLALP